jgi:hypothetical protein
VWGKVVRVDPTSMVMAIIMTRVSDIHAWREICSNILYEQCEVILKARGQGNQA